MSKFFKEIEFNNCTPACSERNMDREFLRMMDNVRELAGIPLSINCAYRSKEWDKSKGRSGNSAHTRGLAVDFRATDSNTRFLVVRAAIELGVKRIGIGENFVHIDCDESLPQRVLFHYY